MITVKLVPDILSQEGRREIMFVPPAKPIYLSMFTEEQLPEIYFGPSDFLDACEIWYRGRVVAPEEYARTRIEDCTEIVLFLRPGKGGTWQLFLGYVLAVIGAVTEQYWLLSIGIGLVIGGITSLIFTPKPGNFDVPGNKNYGWEGATTEYATIGTMVPASYGRVLTGGKCIGQRIYSDENNDQILDLLILISEGEIRGIRKEDDAGVCTSTADDPWIKLDGNFISSIPGASWDYRLGTLDQSPISEFGELSTNYSEGVKIEGETWYEITEAGGGEDFEAVEFNFSFPYGLYITGMHGVYPFTTGVYIEKKQEPSGSWESIGYYSWTDLKMGPFYKTVRVEGLTKANYSFRFKKNRHDYTGEVPGLAESIYIQSYNRILFQALAYPGSALVSIHAVATDRLTSAQPNVQVKLDGKLVPYFDGSEWQDPTWDTGAADEGNVGRNLAWQIHDLLYNEIYGLAAYFDDNLKISAKFKDLADYSNGLIDDGEGGTHARFRSDIIIDGIVDPWDMIIELLRSCHSFPLVAGAQIWPAIEKEASPVMSFGMADLATDEKGNTLFAESWRNLEGSPNLIEVQYFDAEKDYVRETVQYPDDDTLFASGEKIRKMTLVFHNISRRAQAARLAKYHWLLVTRIKHFIRFTAKDEAIALQPGDVFYFSHDIPQLDYSGSIFRVRDSNVIELDNAWDDVPDSGTYKLLIRDLDDDAIETKDVTEITTENGRHLVTYSGAYSFTPAAGDPYILIRDTTVPAKYVCVELSRDESMRRVIEAQQYDPDIYDYEVDTIEPPDYSDLPNPNAPPDPPTDLMLVEMPQQIGFWVNAVVPTGALNYDHTRIYISTDGEYWDEVGRVKEVKNFPVTGVLPGIEYYIKVATFNRVGMPCANPPTASIIIIGFVCPPVVRGLEIYGQGNDNEFVGKDCKIRWKLAGQFMGLGVGDFGQEGLGLGEGQHQYIKDTKVSVYLDGIERRTEFLPYPADAYTYTLEKNIEDMGTAQRSFEFRLWYRDNYNRLSPEYASLSVTNSAPSLAGKTPTVSDISYGFRIEWDECPHYDVDKYHVYCDENNPPTTIRARVSSYETLVNIVDLDPNTTYFVKVVPGDPYGMGTASNIVQKSVPIPGMIVPVGPDDPTELGEIKLIEEILEFDDCDDYTKWTAETGGIVLATDGEALKEGTGSLKAGIDKYTCVAENLWYTIPNPPWPPAVPTEIIIGDTYHRYTVQGFKVDSNCDLKRVGIPLSIDNGSPPGCKVMIYDANGNKPGTKLGEATFAGANWTEAYRWADFATPVSLAASTQYYFVICRTDEGAGSDFYTTRAGEDKYGDAQYDYYQYGDSLDNLTPETGMDVLFRLFKDEATLNNHFKITSLGTKDISDYPRLEFWVKSNKTTANWLQISMGESALGEQTINCSTPSTWNPIVWDLSAIAAGDRDAIAYFGFKILDADPSDDPPVPEHGKIWLWIDYVRATKGEKVRVKFAGEARTIFPQYPFPLSIGPAAFMPKYDNQDWEISTAVKNRALLDSQNFFAPIMLPHEARILKVTLFGYRNDADSILMLVLYRISSTGVFDMMASIIADWTTGESSKSDASISYPFIDNENYHYALLLNINPNDSVEDCYFHRCRVDWQ